MYLRGSWRADGVPHLVKLRLEGTLQHSLPCRDLFVSIIIIIIIIFIIFIVVTGCGSSGAARAGNGPVCRSASHSADAKPHPLHALAIHHDTLQLLLRPRCRTRVGGRGMPAMALNMLLDSHRRQFALKALLLFLYGTARFGWLIALHEVVLADGGTRQRAGRPVCPRLLAVAFGAFLCCRRRRHNHVAIAVVSIPSMSGNLVLLGTLLLYLPLNAPVAKTLTHSLSCLPTGNGLIDRLIRSCGRQHAAHAGAMLRSHGAGRTHEALRRGTRRVWFRLPVYIHLASSFLRQSVMSWRKPTGMRDVVVRLDPLHHHLAMTAPDKPNAPEILHIAQVMS